MNKSISQTIREAMIATRLTDREISRQAGVSQPQISAFRKGSNPRASTIDALARLLGFTLSREPRRAIVKTKQTSGERMSPAGRSTSKHPHAAKERENESERL